MSEIIEEMERYLEEQECVFQVNDEGTWVSFGFDAVNVRWRSVAGEDDHGRFVSLSFLPLVVPMGRRMAVAELITRMNFGLGLGHFILDFEDGDLRFMVTVPLGGVAPSQEVIAEVMGAHQALVDTFLPAIGQVLFSSTPPQLALQADGTVQPAGTGERFSLN